MTARRVRRTPATGAARSHAKRISRPEARASRLEIAPDVHWLTGRAETAPLFAAIDALASRAPFRQYVVRGGGRMSVAMTNCGTWGWYSDERGYRYTDVDPVTGNSWPPMPACFVELSTRAAEECGYAGFVPDACLVNRYVPGAQMGAHRDADERDFAQPIVSVSLGLPVVFAWHGARRADAPVELPLENGDVVVWGGTARLGYHAVRRLRAPRDAAPGAVRYNLTFRRAR